MGKSILSLLLQGLFATSCVSLYTARADGSERHSRAPEQIDAKMYHMFQTMANYTSASYSSCGYAPYNAVLVDYVNVQKTTTQGVIFRDDTTQKFDVAFPGTSGPEDSRLDFMDKKVPYRTLGLEWKDCKYCHVHDGFLTAYDSIAKPLSKALTAAMADYPTYKLSITGHSLGAAIASLATSSLIGQGFKIERTVTFGEPRVGGPRYANHIDNICGASEKDAGKYHRVTHANDGVPQAPSLAQGYRHSRTEYWESMQNTEDWQTTYRCFGQEPTNCNDGTKPSSLEDQAHGYYVGIVMGSVAADCAS